MISSEIKMMVAQNCLGYQATSVISMMSMGELSQSCNNCKNYIRGKCQKDLFDDIVEKIRIN